MAVHGLGDPRPHQSSLTASTASALAAVRPASHAVKVPANTTATVCVPTTQAAQVTESGKPARAAVGVKLLRADKFATYYEVDSGSYSFEAPFPSRLSEK